MNSLHFNISYLRKQAKALLHEYTISASAWYSSYETIEERYTILTAFSNLKFNTDVMLCQWHNIVSKYKSAYLTKMNKVTCHLDVSLLFPDLFMSVYVCLNSLFAVCVVLSVKRLSYIATFWQVKIQHDGACFKQIHVIKDNNWLCQQSLMLFIFCDSHTWAHV